MATFMSNPFTMDQQDDMEITDHAQDDIDFDIDFENPPGDQIPTNEDEMEDDVPVNDELEDIELRSATAEADYMIDDVVQDGQDDPDGVMIDDPPVEEADEELLDFSDEEIGYDPQSQNQVAEALPPTQDAQDSVAAPEVSDLSAEQQNLQPDVAVAAELNEDTQGTSVHTPVAEDNAVPAIVVEEVEEDGLGHDFQTRLLAEAASATTHDASTLTEAEHNIDPLDAERYDNKTTIDSHGLDHAQHASAGGIKDLTNQGAQNEDGSHQDVTHTDNGADQERSEDDRHVTALGQNIDERVINAALQDPEPGQDSPQSSSSDGHHTYTGLHTTVVKYEGGEYYLFPAAGPNEGGEYFLENENLASGSIGDLLHACRLTLGEDISEDEELELHVEDFGLYLKEDSTAAFSTSFSELLDIFVQLHRQDGNDQPPPMTVSLSRKARFANRLTLLANAAAEGKGISQLSFLPFYINPESVVHGHRHGSNDDLPAAETSNLAKVTDNEFKPPTHEQLGEGGSASRQEDGTRGINIEHDGQGDGAASSHEDEATSHSEVHQQSSAVEQLPQDTLAADYQGEEILEETEQPNEHNFVAEFAPDAEEGSAPVEHVAGTSEEQPDDHDADGETVATIPSNEQESFEVADPHADDPTAAPLDDDDDFLDFTDEDPDPVEQQPLTNKRSIEDVVEAEDQENKRPRSS